MSVSVSKGVNYNKFFNPTTAGILNITHTQCITMHKQYWKVEMKNSCLIPN